MAMGVALADSGAAKWLVSGLPTGGSPVVFLTVVIAVEHGGPPGPAVPLGPFVGPGPAGHRRRRRRRGQPGRRRVRLHRRRGLLPHPARLGQAGHALRAGPRRPHLHPARSAAAVRLPGPADRRARPALRRRGVAAARRVRHPLRSPHAEPCRRSPQRLQGVPVRRGGRGRHRGGRTPGPAGRRDRPRPAGGRRRGHGRRPVRRDRGPARDRARHRPGRRARRRPLRAAGRPGTRRWWRWRRSRDSPWSRATCATRAPPPRTASAN